MFLLCFVDKACSPLLQSPFLPQSPPPRPESPPYRPAPAHWRTHGLPPLHSQDRSAARSRAPRHWCPSPARRVRCCSTTTSSVPSARPSSLERLSWSPTSSRSELPPTRWVLWYRAWSIGVHYPQANDELLVSSLVIRNDWIRQFPRHGLWTALLNGLLYIMYCFTLCIGQYYYAILVCYYENKAFVMPQYDLINFKTCSLSSLARPVGVHWWLAYYTVLVLVLQY